MPYRYIEDLAWADVAFVAEGKTLPELFDAAGKALTGAMVKDITAIWPETERRVKAEGASVEEILHKFLEELVYYKDAQGMLFASFGAKIERRNEKWLLDAACVGEPIDRSRHQFVVDVKAVTWHKFRVVETEKGWEATVVVDV